jgi:hypothetical protein
MIFHEQGFQIFDNINWFNYSTVCHHILKFKQPIFGFQIAHDNINFKSFVK